MLRHSSWQLGESSHWQGRLTKGGSHRPYFSPPDGWEIQNNPSMQLTPFCPRLGKKCCCPKLGPGTLTPLILVRIQVPQPLEITPLFSSFELERRDPFDNSFWRICSGSGLHASCRIAPFPACEWRPPLAPRPGADSGCWGSTARRPWPVIAATSPSRCSWPKPTGWPRCP